MGGAVGDGRGSRRWEGQWRVGGAAGNGRVMGNGEGGQ